MVKLRFQESWKQRLCFPSKEYNPFQLLIKIQLFGVTDTRFAHQRDIKSLLVDIKSSVYYLALVFRIGFFQSLFLLVCKCVMHNNAVNILCFCYK